MKVQFSNIRNFSYQMSKKNLLVKYYQLVTNYIMLMKGVKGIRK